MNEPTVTEPTVRPDRIHVLPDPTPGPHRTDSDDKWWLPVIGPTATTLAYLLARHAAYQETTWDTLTLARTVGLGNGRSKLWLSLERLAMFRVATFHGTDTLAIRLYLPALTNRNLASLPDCLAAAYLATPH